MDEVLLFLRQVTDMRQKKKIKHKMSDIIALVLLATLANADEWTEIAAFGEEHEGFLRQFLELPCGIPSHDTLQRVFAMVPPDFMERAQKKWNEALSIGEGEAIRKMLALDGKTQRGNGNKGRKANHIVSAVDENGFCLGQKLVGGKTNEITAIPALLDDLNIKGKIVTTDAMGAQTAIAGKIREKRGDYVLALKGNQSGLLECAAEYFGDPDLLKGCEYACTIEKARGGVEKREYWQTGDISWLAQGKNWAGLKTMAMTRNTIVKDGVATEEARYFISSLPPDAALIARAIRGHWMVESYHWHLDVTFREDGNHTLEKDAAYNLNIIRKMAINLLKLLDVFKKPRSLKKKRFIIGTNPEKYLAAILKA